ncbi:MAG: RNA methyltransferase, partial [Lachnospiraceae bacterium]|nr:RNA methyltransferase [Lachnospiraceae bacterium]
MITSVSNPKVKNICALLSKKKTRDEEGCFVIEGRKPVLEAIESDLEVTEVYLSETFANEGSKAEDFGGNCEIVSDKVFEKLSQTVTPQGVAAVVRQPAYDLEKLMDAGAKRFLILEDIRDPGNLGTMVRTAEAAGIDCVIMTVGTVDIFNPKVIRSTMGSVLRVPFVYVRNLKETFERLKGRGVRIYGTSLASSVDYREADLSGSVGIVIGNEASGMSP